MIGDKGARVRLSMDKDWCFHLGDISCSLGKKHAGVYNYTKAGGIGGPAKVNFINSDRELVNLPHDWAVRQDFSQDANANQGYKPRGIGRYRKLFRLDESDSGMKG